jgi:ribosome-binding protein aMBF1 (putative translation factor)
MSCELCGRAVETTTHHLVPKNRKESPTTQLCEPCHKQVHAAFTHAELKREYDTVEALRSADRLRPFVRWIRTTNKTDVRVAESEHVRRWRR